MKMSASGRNQLGSSRVQTRRPTRSGRVATCTAACRSPGTFPERGTARDDLRPGLRTTTYRRRVTIAFHITATQVVIDRILYGGRDLPALFEEGDDR